MLRILGNHGRPDSASSQGATFNFQILKPNGEVGGVGWGGGQCGGVEVAGGLMLLPSCWVCQARDSCMHRRLGWLPSTAVQCCPQTSTPSTYCTPICAGVQLPARRHCHGSSRLPHAHRLHLQPGRLLRWGAGRWDGRKLGVAPARLSSSSVEGLCPMPVHGCAQQPTHAGVQVARGCPRPPANRC